MTSSIAAAVTAASSTDVSIIRIAGIIIMVLGLAVIAHRWWRDR